MSTAYIRAYMLLYRRRRRRRRRTRAAAATRLGHGTHTQANSTSRSI
jgi:hypothetical protein